MAKYNVRFACGHVEERQLLGKIDQRQTYIAWAAESGRCSACRRDDKAAQVDAIEAEHNMPALTGSPKQIAWARTIRADLVKAVADLFAGLSPAAGKEDEAEQFVAAIMVKIVSHEESRWWIDRREVSPREIARSMARA